MIDDLHLAKLCQCVYSGGAGFDAFFDENDIVAGLLRVDEHIIVVFRGSVTAEDWLRDLDEIPADTTELGRVHAGFFTGMRDFLAHIGVWLTGRVVLTGHSLGAARACIMAGLMTAAGHPPTQLALFGCPRPGYAKLRDLVQQSGTQITSYRQGDDPVPEVPWLLGMYQHVIEPQRIGTSGPIAAEDHFIARYVDALQSITPQ